MTAEYGVPGIKVALEMRGQPAGDPRRPLRPLADDERLHLETVLEEALESTTAR